MLEMVNHTENGECSDIMVGFMRFPFANLNTIDTMLQEQGRRRKLPLGSKVRHQSNMIDAIFFCETFLSWHK
jgi:hypothetical protein